MAATRQQTPVWQSIVWTLTGTVLGLASFFTILALMLVNLSKPAAPAAEGQLSPIERSGNCGRRTSGS